MTPVIAVTGASGFVGSALCRHLQTLGHPVVPLLRTPRPEWPGARIVGELGPETDWTNALQGVDVVVHCAARAHIPLRPGPQDLEICRRINVEGTRSLAQAAVRSGVQRLVHVSSIKVLGESSPPGAPLRADSPPAPEDAYGVSKQEAELALQAVTAQTGLQTVIVRPPLVYGPGVKANFLRLMQAVHRGVPLPLGSVHNLRSMVALDNLTDLLALCAVHPAAAGQTFLVSDGQDLSTPDLIRGMAQALGRPARLLPFPPSWLRLAGRLTGRADQVERLIGSLQVDIGHTRRVLQWAPGCTVQQGLQSATRDVR
ncbi:UDP-glucose 4-epimerase family protein [Hydrogenophaga sp. MI9]|uniref:UDP-glucose 4-epimerase family protein n=1 Tax=Hydrogenophaga sp. MI9 TaxID=3453719 RepID=UPI003EEE6072